jgi:esterase FrsA
MNPKTCPISPDINLYYLGPHLDEGPLPAVFYFSISGKGSLTLDPLNQPALVLNQYPMRIFSIDLPGHLEGVNPKTAMQFWAEAVKKGDDFIASFCDKVALAIDTLKSNKVLCPEQCGIAGLSRGAFLAVHVANRCDAISAILGFAPLSRLDQLDELINTPESVLAKPFNLEYHSSNIIGRPFKFFIGNHDTLVGTDNAFGLVHSLVDESVKKGVKSPPVSLSIYPSIGHKGHGTPKEIFEEGAQWMAKQVGLGQ